MLTHSQLAALPVGTQLYRVDPKTGNLSIITKAGERTGHIKGPAFTTLGHAGQVIPATYNLNRLTLDLDEAKAAAFAAIAAIEKALVQRKVRVDNFQPIVVR
jgi:hypothetical protein